MNDNIPTNRKPYPILSALKREGDTDTLHALGLWRLEYHDTPPQVAANDNDPDTRPVEWETSTYEHDAMYLIQAFAEDENNKGVPGYVPQYSAALHGEVHKPRIRRTTQPMPPAADVDGEAEMARHIDAQKMRSWLGADAEIMDMAIGPYTYEDIGRHIGVNSSDKTAYRAGRQEVKDVARTFYEEAT